MSNAQWKFVEQVGSGGPTSSGVPNCQRVQCNDPPAILNGLFPEKLYYYDDVVEYQCDYGYYNTAVITEPYTCTADEGEAEVARLILLFFTFVF